MNPKPKCKISSNYTDTWHTQSAKAEQLEPSTVLHIRCARMVDFIMIQQPINTTGSLCVHTMKSLCISNSKSKYIKRTWNIKCKIINWPKCKLSHRIHWPIQVSSSTKNLNLRRRRKESYLQKLSLCRASRKDKYQQIRRTQKWMFQNICRRKKGRDQGTPSTPKNLWRIRRKISTTMQT